MPTPATARTFRHRAGAFVAAVLVMATGTVFWAAPPAAAAPLSDQCSVQQWQDPGQWSDCVGKLQNLTADEAQCVAAPIPEAPDSGMAGWFASQPNSLPSRADGRYTRYGYAGYDYTTYDIGCTPVLMHPDYKFENTIANGEFMFATTIVGASNAIRDKAWDPSSLWGGWADNFLQRATDFVYKRVFQTFGGVTLALIGLYLLWRSRQANMNHAVTTAGWAVLVMTIVMALAAWPTRSAHLADQGLTTGIAVAQGAVGPSADNIPPDQCAVLPHPEQCIDHRTASQRASDLTAENVLYQNWLRGELGSSDSPVAQKYGPVLYDAKALSWEEANAIKNDKTGAARQRIISSKQSDWEKVAKQIKSEDGDAYQYLQGTKGMDRIGAGFIAILSALCFTLFDITASIMVLLSFFVFRFAIIAAPLIGTVGMLRPASLGVRRLVNMVLASFINIIAFAFGDALYLSAVNLIVRTSISPWIQTLLIVLAGAAGWLILRPRLKFWSLGARDPLRDPTLVDDGSGRFINDVRAAIAIGNGQNGGRGASGRADLASADSAVRPETRAEDGMRVDPLERQDPVPARPEQDETDRSVRRRLRDWVGPPSNEDSPNYAIYRPGDKAETPPASARRPESLNVRG